MDPTTQDQSTATPSAEPANSPRPERPALNTPISTPTAEQRPVGTWAPAAQAEFEPEQPPVQPEATQASTPNLEPMISGTTNTQTEQLPPEQQAQQVGQELTELSLSPQVQPRQASDATAPNQQLPAEFFAAQTTNQTPPKKPHSKLKKVLLSLFGFFMLLALLLGAYIMFFGNKAASDYKENSSITTYKEAFEQISQSLQKSPADKATLEAGVNKLKIAENNQTTLSSIFLGKLNPNYKKAKQLGTVINEYRTSTKTYQENYAFANFLTALSSSDQTLNLLIDLGKTDFKTVPVETFNQNLTTATQNCSQLITDLKESVKPSDLSVASDSFTNAINEICSQLPTTLQEVTNGKSGLLGQTDQANITRILTATNNNISSIINGSSISSFYINQLTSYTRAAKDESARLLKEAEAILAN